MIQSKPKLFSHCLKVNHINHILKEYYIHHSEKIFFFLQLFFLLYLKYSIQLFFILTVNKQRFLA